MEELSSGLAAFHADLQEQINNLTVVVMSEFGRRAYENASLGTDHGHSSLMMLLDGNARVAERTDIGRVWKKVNYLDRATSPLPPTIVMFWPRCA